MAKMYFQTHLRGSCYLIGMVLGFFLQGKLPKIFNLWVNIAVEITAINHVNSLMFSVHKNVDVDHYNLLHHFNISPRTKAKSKFVITCRQLAPTRNISRYLGGLNIVDYFNYPQSLMAVDNKCIIT